jgi:hypothetical protein
LLASRYPQTKSSILFEDKFDPFDLYKLHTEFGPVSSDATSDEFFMTPFDGNSGPGNAWLACQTLAERIPPRCLDHFRL